MCHITLLVSHSGPPPIFRLGGILFSTDSTVNNKLDLWCKVCCSTQTAGQEQSGKSLNPQTQATILAEKYQH